MRLKKIDHFSKSIYVGIDVHKKTYTFCAVGEHIKNDKVSNIPADPEILVKTLKNRYPGAKLKTAYEAGFSGFVLHRKLMDSGIENIVVNAASIEVAANDKVKNDKRDAAKIASQLFCGKLTNINIPTLEEESNRQLTRTRAQLVKEKTRIGNQIKSKLFQFGYIKFDDEREMSLKLLKEFESLNLPSALKIAIKSLADVYKSIHHQIVFLEKEIRIQASQDQEIEDIYQSFSGVGFISARTLANELRDMSFIHSQKAVFAFIGFTPSEYSSGDKDFKGHITRQGRSCIRQILVEVAWRAIREDTELAKIYNRLKPKIGGKRAIVAVARKMVGKMRGCLQNRTLYQMNFSS